MSTLRPWAIIVVLVVVSANSPREADAQQSGSWHGEWKFATQYVPNAEGFRRRPSECMTQVWESKYLTLTEEPGGMLSGGYILVRRVTVLGWRGAGTQIANYVQRCALPGAKMPLDGAQVKTFRVRGRLSGDRRKAEIVFHSGACQSANDWCEGSSELAFRGGARDDSSSLELTPQGLLKRWSGPTPAGGTAEAADLYLAAAEFDARSKRLVAESEKLVSLLRERAYRRLYDAQAEPKAAPFDQMSAYWESFFRARGGRIEDVQFVEALFSTDSREKPWWGTMTFDVLTNQGGAGRLYVLMRGAETTQYQPTAVIWR